jgi:acetyltransferase
MAVDGRVRLQATRAPAQARLAIRPYPKEFETTVTAGGRSYGLRPIRPEDELALRRFADAMDDADLWHPFFAPLRARTHESAARLSQIDYDREMTLIAWDEAGVAGLARATADPDFDTAECAVAIRAGLREQGLATNLVAGLGGVLAAQGVRRAVLNFPETQARIRSLADDLGFEVVRAGDGWLRATKALRR